MFWIISVLLVIAAVAFLVPALRKNNHAVDATREQNIAIAQEKLAELESIFNKGDMDESSYQSSRDEIERSLFNDLSDSKVLNAPLNQQSLLSQILVLLLIPLIAIPAYFKLGDLNFTKALDPQVGAIESSKSTMPLKADGTPDIEKIVENLQVEMDGNPTDPKGWYMLGRSYMLLSQFPQAAESFEKSLSLRPDSAESMLSLADALSMSNNGILKGRPRSLVNTALSHFPNNQTALWLSGMAASQEGEYIEAITKWTNLLGLIKDKPKDVAAVEGLISEAKNRLNAEQVSVLDKQLTKKVGTESNRDKSQSKLKSVRVTVALTDALKDKTSPEDSVFIYAKASNGPPMPLAAVRRQVKDLPLTIVLDDKMAMMPSLTLSSFSQVSVGARISKSGQAISQAGDLFDEKQEIKLGAEVSLTIDKVLEK